MEIAKIQVSGVRAKLMDQGPGRWEIPAGIIGATIRFHYGPDWEKLSKTVVFACGNVTKDVTGAGELVQIPAEVVARPERKLLVGVYGVDEGCETATPTLWVEGRVCAAADPSGDSSADSALPVWAQLEARIRALEASEKTYSVTNILENVHNSNGAVSVPQNAAYTATLTAAEAYTLQSVTVTMGGADITAQVYSGGAVHIPAVTGDLVIRAEAVKIQRTFVNALPAVYAGSAFNEAGNLVTATENWKYTPYIPVAEGQVFRYWGDTSAYAKYLCVWGFDLSMAPVQVLLGNGSYPQGQEFTVPAGIAAIRCCWYIGSSGTWGLEILESCKDAAGEAAFIPDISIDGSGAVAPKAGAGATDFVSVAVGDVAAMYNLVPAKGGRFAFYDSGKNFLDAVAVYTASANDIAIVTAEVTNASAAYVRMSANTVENVRACVRAGV